MTTQHLHTASQGDQEDHPNWWGIQSNSSGMFKLIKGKEQWACVYKLVKDKQDSGAPLWKNRVSKGGLGFLGGSEGKESAWNAGDLSSIHGLGRSPGKGNGNPLQYSCLENSKDRGGWQATVHGFAKRWTQLNDFHFPQPGDRNNNSSPNYMGLVWVLKNNVNGGLSISSGPQE